MRNRHKPALRRMLGMDGKPALDAQEFLDGSGGLSLSEVFASSPALQKEVADAEAERRRARDCQHFGSTTSDAGATIQTSRRKATLTGYR